MCVVGLSWVVLYISSFIRIPIPPPFLLFLALWYQLYHSVSGGGGGEGWGGFFVFVSAMIAMSVFFAIIVALRLSTFPLMPFAFAYSMFIQFFLFSLCFFLDLFLLSFVFSLFSSFF